MPQLQHDITVRFLDGSTAVGTRTGNNAAWLCSCGYLKPLVGFSSAGPQPGDNTIVICPSCGRRFQVDAPTDRAVPTGVKEIGENAHTTDDLDEEFEEDDE